MRADVLVSVMPGRHVYSGRLFVRTAFLKFRPNANREQGYTVQTAHRTNVYTRPWIRSAGRFGLTFLVRIGLVVVLLKGTSTGFTLTVAQIGCFLHYGTALQPGYEVSYTY